VIVSHGVGSPSSAGHGGRQFIVADAGRGATSPVCPTVRRVTTHNSHLGWHHHWHDRMPQNVPRCLNLPDMRGLRRYFGIGPCWGGRGEREEGPPGSRQSPHAYFRRLSIARSSLWHIRSLGATVLVRSLIAAETVEA
jgi:hypothetical protein